MADIVKELREAVDEMSKHQFSHNREAMTALQVLIDRAWAAAEYIETMPTPIPVELVELVELVKNFHPELVIDTENSTYDKEVIIAEITRLNKDKAFVSDQLERMKVIPNEDTYYRCNVLNCGDGKCVHKTLDELCPHCERKLVLNISNGFVFCSNHPDVCGYERDSLKKLGGQKNV
jgi:rubrerythrin